MGFRRTSALLAVALSGCLGSGQVRPINESPWRGLAVDPGLPRYEPPTPAIREAIEIAQKAEQEAKRTLEVKAGSCSESSGLQAPTADSVVDQIIDEAQRDYGCKVVEVNRGGRLVDHSVVERGYGRLIGRSFAHQMCSQPPRPRSSEILRLPAGQTGGGPKVDALSHFGSGLPLPGSSGMDAETAAMANSYSLLYSLGRAESDGFANEGEDMSASRSRPVSAIESGMFQVSYDVMSSDPRFDGLRQYWLSSVSSLRSVASAGGSGALAAQCGIDTDRISGLKWHKKAEGGSQPAETLLNEFKVGGSCIESAFEPAKCFRAMNRFCPQFAVDFSVVGIRLNRPHWGPLNRYAIKPSCGAIFEKLHARKAEVCSQPGYAPLQPWADPARNDD